MDRATIKGLNNEDLDRMLTKGAAINSELFPGLYQSLRREKRRRDERKEKDGESAKV
jgi:hypothetical protein